MVHLNQKAMRTAIIALLSPWRKRKRHDRSPLTMMRYDVTERKKHGRLTMEAKKIMREDLRHLLQKTGAPFQFLQPQHHLH